MVSARCCKEAAPKFESTYGKTIPLFVHMLTTQLHAKDFTSIMQTGSRVEFGFQKSLNSEKLCSRKISNKISCLHLFPSSSSLGLPE
jgi:hypothetical protein